MREEIGYCINNTETDERETTERDSHEIPPLFLSAATQMRMNFGFEIVEKPPQTGLI